jgi:hypothetical protein
MVVKVLMDLDTKTFGDKKRTVTYDHKLKKT